MGGGKAKAGGVGGLSSKKYVRKPTSSSSASSRSIAEASQSQIAVERLVAQTNVGRISNGGNTLPSSGNISSNTKHNVRNKGKGEPLQTSSVNPKLQIPVPPRVQSRINLANGKKSTEGWNHVIKSHYSGKPGKSEFVVGQQELREILQSQHVVKSPIISSFMQVNLVDQKKTFRFVREVDTGKVIGIDKFSGRQPTSIITIMTDEAGNLITATPGKWRTN